jgi:predicted metal-dependent hydrolase
MRLRFDDRNQLLKLTHPPRTARSAALAWAASQQDWIRRQIERAHPPQPFAPGVMIPIEGEAVELRWSETAGRTPMLHSGSLTCGGPPTGFAGRVERFLKRMALDRLSSETAQIAAAAGLKPVKVSIGDAGTRWGSCSGDGRIRYSWRLILAAPEARRFVVAHEVAHLRHMDHGPDFHRLERELFGGDTSAAQALLREAGPRLRRIGVAR